MRVLHLLLTVLIAGNASASPSTLQHDQAKDAFGVVDTSRVGKAALQTDPIRDRWEGTTLKKDDYLLRLDIDIDDDDRKDLCISLASKRDGQQGNMWAVYKGVRRGYKYVGEAEFHDDVYLLRYIKPLHRHGLISFSPGGGGTGVFVAYTIQGNELVETNLEAARNWSQYHALMHKYFPEKPVGIPLPKARKISTVELAKKYNIHLE